MSFLLIPIKFGFVEEGIFIGWTALPCNFCNTVQPAACFDISRQNTLYGLKVTNQNQYAKRLICSFCNELYDLPPNVRMSIDVNWQPNNGIQSLITATRPDLGFVSQKSSRTTNEVTAILKRTEEWVKYSFHNQGNKGCLMGIFAFIALVIGGIIGNNIPPSGDVKNFAVVFGVPFAVVSCILFYFLLKRFGIRRMLLQRLQIASEEKGIKKEDYIKAMSRMNFKKASLIWAVNRLPK